MNEEKCMNCKIEPACINTCKRHKVCKECEQYIIKCSLCKNDDYDTIERGAYDINKVIEHTKNAC